MPSLVTKFGYLKPGARKSPGNYARYIATREGVEKIDDSKLHGLATFKQKELIEDLLRDFPDSRESLEYRDYQAKPTRGNAAEYITRTLEEHAGELTNRKTYADYIATRPRAERLGSHGLFTDAGVEVKLSKVSEELNQYQGNLWTVIFSLRREDAERLGYDHGERWRDLLRGHTQELAEQLHIPLEHLKWYAAFHNEGHHPHVHLIAYSTNEKEGHLSTKGIESLRSSFAREIFAQDLYSVYRDEAQHRDELRREGKETVAELVERINASGCDSPSLQEKLYRLAVVLSLTEGKKVYAYLPRETKQLVNEIVMELAGDERIAALYDLWYRDREKVLLTDTDTLPPRVPLWENEEFRPLRNAVIREALRLRLDSEEEYDPVDQPILNDEEPWIEEDSAEVSMEDTNEVSWASALPVLFREKVSVFRPAQPDTPTGNHHPVIYGTPPVLPAVLRFLRSLGQGTQERLDEEQGRRQGMVDRKQWQAIREKKEALGLRQ